MSARIKRSAAALRDSSFVGDLDDPVEGDPDDVEGTLSHKAGPAMGKAVDVKKFEHVYDWGE